MKSKFISLSLLAGAVMLTFTSCGDKKNKKEEPAAPVQQEVAKPEPVLSYIPAVALYNPGALYKPDKDDDGLMVWNQSVNCGTRLEAYSYSDKGVEMKTAVRIVNKEKQERQFVHVRYNGDDYWIQDVTVALKAKPGVITSDEVFLYKEADIKSMTNTSLPFGTIIAVSDEGGDSKFACVSVDTEKETFHDVFVKKECIGGDTDLTILSLAAAIEKSKNEVLRSELADALSKFNSPSDLVNERKNEVLDKMKVFDSYIPEEYNPLMPGVYAQDSMTDDDGWDLEENY
ncbi:MAG: hypothetical protein IJU95_06745 [Treponema sp.]|nr:hypothetical protein [Treponema sp.]